MKQKILAVMLSVVIAMCGTVSAFAADLTPTSTSSDTVVECTVDATWTATVPEYIVPNEMGEQDVSAYSVSINSALLESDTKLKGTVKYSGTVKEENDVGLTYSLYSENGEITSGNVIVSKDAGDPNTVVSTNFGAALTDKARYAGTYTDTATFSFYPTRPTVTAEEIEVNPLMFGIGRTSPEYVVAEFNEDFSTVHIYANGENSDGLSKHFASPTADPTYPIYANKTTLKTVIVEEGVVGLGGNAFAMTNIETISLPDTLKSIYTGCFNGCKKLTGFVIPDGVEELGKGAFRNCSAAVCELKLPSSLKTLGSQAFYGCSKLTGSVVIPDGVEEIGSYAFGNCSSLNGTITFGDNVRVIGERAFNNCAKIHGGLTMPASLHTIGPFAFQSMRGLDGELILNEGLVHIGDGAFNHCRNMTNQRLVIPSTVTSIGGDTNFTVTETSASAGPAPSTYYNYGTHIFYDFANEHIQEYKVASGSESFKDSDGVLLTKDGSRLLAYPVSREGATYEIPEGVTTIDEMAFGRGVFGSATEKLTKLVLPNSYVVKVAANEQSPNALNRGNGNSLSIALYTHNTVAEIAVKDDNPNYKTVDGCLYSKDGTKLYYVPIMKEGTVTVQEGTETIVGGALYGFSKAAEHPHFGKTFTLATEIVLPASYTTVYNISLSRLNEYMKYGGTVTVTEGNTALEWSNGTLVATGETIKDMAL